MPKKYKNTRLTRKLIKLAGGINQGDPGSGLKLKAGGQAAPARLSNVNSIAGGGMNLPIYLSADQAIAYGCKPGFSYNIGIPVNCGEDNQCIETLGGKELSELCGTEGFQDPAIVMNSNITVTMGKELFEYGSALFESALASDNIASLQDSVTRLNEEANAIAQARKDAQADLKSVNSDIETLTSDKDNVETQIAAESAALAAEEVALAKEKATYAELGCEGQAEPSEQCQLTADNIETIETAMTERIQKIAKLRDELADLLEQLDKKQAELDGLNAAFEAIEAQYNGIQTRLKLRQVAISSQQQASLELLEKANAIKNCVIQNTASYYNSIGMSESEIEGAMSTVLLTYVSFDKAMGGGEDVEEPKAEKVAG